MASDAPSEPSAATSMKNAFMSNLNRVTNTIGDLVPSKEKIQSAVSINILKQRVDDLMSGRGKGGSMPEVKEEELRAVFTEFDLDGDQYIQESELKSVMAKMGQSPSPDELTAMFKAADRNGDGKIDFEEFIAIARSNPLSLSLKSVFGELDADGDGYITRSEMRHAFDKMGHSLTDDEINAIFHQVDFNKDGKINFEEFVAMMCRKRN